MRNIEMYPYDPLKVTVTINGRIMTGFKDSLITAARNEDIVIPQAGVQGDFSLSENANESGKISMSFMSTSPSLQFLRNLAQNREWVSIMISDVNDTDDIKIHSENGRILKVADAPRGKQETGVAVDVFVPQLFFQ